MELLALALVALYLLSRADRRGAGVDVSGPDYTGSISLPYSTDGGGLDNFTQAVFQFEGGAPGNINVRNNNPGNLRAGPGMTGTSGGFATFADQGDGWDALGSWVTNHAAKNPQWDFYDTFDQYLRGSTTAPSVDNQGDSDAYAEYVAGYMGVDPSTTVSSALGGS